MTAIEIARVYTDIVNVYNSIPDEEAVSRDAVTSLRSSYHQLLMDVFRSEGIQFADRFEAARIAFEMVENGQEVENEMAYTVYYPGKRDFAAHVSRAISGTDAACSFLNIQNDQISHPTIVIVEPSKKLRIATEVIVTPEDMISWRESLVEDSEEETI